MPQSLSKVLVHLIFSAKHREPLIGELRWTLRAQPHSQNLLHTGEYDPDFGLIGVRRLWALVGGPFQYHDTLHPFRNCCYFMSDPDFNTRASMTHQGNPNMPINRFFALTFAAMVIPDHPMARTWMDVFRDSYRSLHGDPSKLQQTWWYQRTLGRKDQVKATGTGFEYTSQWGPKMSVRFLQPNQVAVESRQGRAQGPQYNYLAKAWTKAGSPTVKNGNDTAVVDALSCPLQSATVSAPAMEPCNA